MNSSIGQRLKKAWNAFFNQNNSINSRESLIGYYNRPDRVRMTRGNERSIITKQLQK